MERKWFEFGKGQFVLASTIGWLDFKDLDRDRGLRCATAKITDHEYHDKRIGCEDEQQRRGHHA